MPNPRIDRQPGTRALRLQEVSMSYAGQRGRQPVLALDRISLDIPDGQFVSVVGPSGCGKSTLLMIVDGLVTPSTGQVTLGGAPITGPGPDRAIAFQEASLLPWFTLLRNCGYGLECRGVPRAEADRRARELVKLVGLSGFEDRYPHELSIGMQQRANLARAIAVDPAVLLMDEPFAALDAQTRELMQGELLDIWAQTRKTVLFITHQIDEAIYLSDRVVVMSARPGRIVDDIAVDLDRPRSLHIKRTPAFAAYEERIWATLETEVKRSMRQETAALGEGDAG
ncbi:MAG TPA: ABC transporter ATP-binding protein [Candidatus Limnocylindrales bacterium]|nr:ABC transporter ATP-binding protein [Candidatus Limnocylindrales bacterium]